MCLGEDVVLEVLIKLRMLKNQSLALHC